MTAPTHTEAPDLAAALDAIDLQLTTDSPEVVLPRDHAQLLAALLTDLLDMHSILDPGSAIDDVFSRITDAGRHPNPQGGVR